MVCRPGSIVVKPHEMIDTHTHLYLPEFDVDGGGEAAVDRAVKAGVGRMIFPNVDAGTIEPLERLAAKFPGRIFRAMGLHPTEVNGDWRPIVDDMMARMDADSGYVAVGEVGIDLYWDKTYEQEQMDAFDFQVGEAVRRGLPLIIHCREGLSEALEVLSAHPGAQGVFHSFGGSADDVEAIRQVGDFYFGINGIVTFKNSGLGAVLPAIGADRILLETDSPYLAPVPRRGKRNESAYLPYTAAKVAECLNLGIDDIDRITTQNAERLFGLGG